MALIREQFMELEGVLRTVYDIEMKKRKDYVPKFFNEETSKRSEENHFGMGSIGLMKPWTGSVNYDTTGKRWKTTYRHAKFSNGLQIEREAVMFKEYSDIKRRTRLLAYSDYLTRQMHGSSVFNNAFDTTKKGADGKPLCALSAAGHPYSPDDLTHTQYNGFTNLEPSTEAFETVRKHMIEATDDRGNILGVNPNAVVFGNEYWGLMRKLLETPKEPFSAENTKNIFNQELTPMYWPWIKGKKWFMVDTEMMKLYLNWYNARKPKVEYEDNFDTEIGKYKIVGLWSYAWDEWFWLAGARND